MRVLLVPSALIVCLVGFVAGQLVFLAVGNIVNELPIPLSVVIGFSLILTGLVSGLVARWINHAMRWFPSGLSNGWNVGFCAGATFVAYMILTNPIGLSVEVVALVPVETYPVLGGLIVGVTVAYPRKD